MDLQTSAAQQLEFTHQTVTNALGECDPAILNRSLPGAAIQTIGVVYAHLVFAEDAFVHARFSRKPTVYETGGWDTKAGIAFPGVPPAITEDWARGVTLDLARFQPYADAVFAATGAYLKAVPAEALDQKIEGATGDYTIGWGIGVLLCNHTAHHAGEISALLGVHGLKGLPF